MSDSKRLSRRELLRSAAVAGVGGLVLGGLLARQASRMVATPAQQANLAGAQMKTKVDKIRIGASLPLTGWGAGDGTEMQRGLQMAIDEVNAQGGVGGIPVELVVLDVEEMPAEKMLSNFQRLIEVEKVHAIIVGYHVSSGPEFDLVAQAKIPYMHVNTTEASAKPVRENRDKYWMIFQGDPTEVWYGIGFAAYMDQLIESGQWKPYNKKLTLITSDNPYSISIADTFKAEAEKRGWTVNIYERVVVPVADWGPTLAKIRKDPPGLIFITDYAPSDLALFTKEFVKDPTPSLLYQQYGPSIPEYLEMAGDAANGVIWSTVIGILPDSYAEPWKQRYRQKFGAEPGGANAGSLYDMTNVYLRAVAMAGDPTDTRKVCSIMENIIHRGVCGTMAFDKSDLSGRPYPEYTKDPSLGMPHLTYQIQNKKHVLVSPEPYTTGQFKLPPWLA
ncbi:ABC transporter substrate-binding protein [Caldinitratiruptor microaerophilus]|uniref:ABC transporter substrate-binding protein n=1 Tax=Caldinitratiruptor microaerophilus TaxID=671077 RepID=A0AA35CJ02_9FIRM|nr:ABC transporter substrate-binding protein [Caldinitratiruptor microaerophilus]BDG60120.1 ABC transporter substrate-binding protein [Caldinitratiruptor microaerophilus]